MRKMFAMVALAVVAALSSPAVDKTPAPNSPAVVNPAADILFTVNQACLKDCILTDRSCSLNCSVAPDPTSCDAGCSAAYQRCRASC